MCKLSTTQGTFPQSTFFLFLISSAQEQRYDVVLIDTAGRMQDNEPLMRALAKLITVNHPDLVLFVGKVLRQDACRPGFFNRVISSRLLKVTCIAFASSL